MYIEILNIYLYRNYRYIMHMQRFIQTKDFNQYLIQKLNKLKELIT